MEVVVERRAKHHSTSQITTPTHRHSLLQTGCHSCLSTNSVKAKHLALPHNIK